MSRSDEHDDAPRYGGDLADSELQETVGGIVGSDYWNYIQRLRPAVEGKLVRSSEAGTSGFLLRFEDETWVVTFLLSDYLVYMVGVGQPAEDVRQKMNAGGAADGAAPLTVDLPYAGEACDLAAELARCHGQAIEGFAIGAGTFNFCFPGGYELETMLLPTEHGSALRVFWEQW